jgi:hypothetical protein
VTSTYIEVSPMNTGFNVFGMLNEADGWTREVAGVTIELYSRDRFVPVTGNRCSRCSRLGFPVGSV